MTLSLAHGKPFSCAAALLCLTVSHVSSFNILQAVSSLLACNKSLLTFDWVSLEKREFFSKIRGATFRRLLQIINHNNKVAVGTPWFPWDPCQKFTAHRVHKLKKKSTSNPPYWTVEQRNRCAINPFTSSMPHTLCEFLTRLQSDFPYMDTSACLIGSGPHNN